MRKRKKLRARLGNTGAFDSRLSLPESTRPPAAGQHFDAFETELSLLFDQVVHVIERYRELKRGKP